jgi:hypothetical protein
MPRTGKYESNVSVKCKIATWPAFVMLMKHFFWDLYTQIHNNMKYFVSQQTQIRQQCKFFRLYPTNLTYAAPALIKLLIKIK